MYQVELDPDLADKKLLNQEQLAYMVDPYRKIIFLSRSGHGRMLRKAADEGFDGGGGWVFLRKRQVTTYSGTLGAVAPSEVSAVVQALGRTLRLPLDVDEEG